MMEATPRQRRILDFIREFSQAQGMPPTRADIAAHFGIERASVQQHLQLLANKGLLEIVPGASRGIRLPEAALARGETHALPLVGRIAAGQPIMSVENIEEQVRVDPAMFRPRASFLFRVEGHSMQDAHILDRDLVAIHQQPLADNHQIVAVAITDEATGDLRLTLKRFVRKGAVVSLLSENADQQRYAPIVVDTREQPLEIIGVFAGLLRAR